MINLFVLIELMYLGVVVIKIYVIDIFVFFLDLWVLCKFVEYEVVFFIVVIFELEGKCYYFEFGWFVC